MGRGGFLPPIYDGENEIFPYPSPVFKRGKYNSPIPVSRVKTGKIKIHPARQVAILGPYMKQRKPIPRGFHYPGRAYFITTVVKDRNPCLQNPVYQFVILKTLAISSVIKKFEISTLAILPDHMHIILTVGDIPITDIMHTFKSNASRQINLLLKPEVHFSWQKSFLDHRVRNEEDLQRRLQYTMDNPLYHNVAGFTWVAQLHMDNYLEQLYRQLAEMLTNPSQEKMIDATVMKIFGLDERDYPDLYILKLGK